MSIATITCSVTGDYKTIADVLSDVKVRQIFGFDSDNYQLGGQDKSYDISDFCSSKFDDYMYKIQEDTGVVVELGIIFEEDKLEYLIEKSKNYNKLHILLYYYVSSVSWNAFEIINMGNTIMYYDSDNQFDICRKRSTNEFSAATHTARIAIEDATDEMPF